MPDLPQELFNAGMNHFKSRSTLFEFIATTRKEIIESGEIGITPFVKIYIETVGFDVADMSLETIEVHMWRMFSKLNIPLRSDAFLLWSHPWLTTTSHVGVDNSEHP